MKLIAVKTEKILKQRWVNENNRVNDIVFAILRNSDWTKLLVEAEDKSHNYKTLPLVNDTAALSGDVSQRDLRGVKLVGIDFSYVQTLSKTNFDFAEIEDCKFIRAELYGCSFRNATIVNTDFSGASLDQCKFINARMNNINFSSVQMKLANFEDAIINKCRFINASIRSIQTSDEPSYWIFYRCWKGNRGTKIRGIEQDLALKDSQNIDENFIYFLKTEKQIERYSSKIPFLSFLFYVVSDYGKNFNRLFLWFLITWFFFGFLYASVLGTQNNSFIFPYYVSLTKLTNFGQVTLKQTNWIADIYFILEQLIGYVLLGILIAMITSRFINEWEL